MKLSFIVVCCLFAFPAIARADGPDQATQQALTSNYQLACAAALNPTDDALQAMFGVLAPDFTSTDVGGGQVSRAQIVDQFGAQLKSFHTTACDSKITSAQSAADGTVITTDVLRMTGSAPVQGGNHSFTLVMTSQDTWSDSTGKWLIARRRELHVHLEMDGSVVMDQGS